MINARLLLPIRLFGREVVVRGPVVVFTAIEEEKGNCSREASTFGLVAEIPRGTRTTLESDEIAPSRVRVRTVIKMGGSSAKSANLNNT